MKAEKRGELDPGKVRQDMKAEKRDELDPDKVRHHQASRPKKERKELPDRRSRMRRGGSSSRH